MAATIAIVAWGSAWAQPVPGNELVAQLKQGGYVLVMRHADSPAVRPDATTAAPGNTRLERQLNENGHKTAKAMGEALKALGIRVGEVLSSPTFRTRETVQDIGLGPPKLFTEIGDGSEGYEVSSFKDANLFLRARAAEVPAAGTNTIIVTHLPNIEFGFPDSACDVDQGEALIIRPDGRNGTPIGRIKIEEWPRLAAQR